MKVSTFLLCLQLLTLGSGVAAQSLPRDAEQLPVRPLNLSVRKQTAPLIDPALLVTGQAAPLTSPKPNAGLASNADAGSAVGLPYGAGFENRQQGNTAGSGNSGNAGGSGGSGGGAGGNGGGGRGGAGRGR